MTSSDELVMFQRCICCTLYFIFHGTNDYESRSSVSEVWWLHWVFHSTCIAVHQSFFQPILISSPVCCLLFVQKCSEGHPGNKPLVSLPLTPQGHARPMEQGMSGGRAGIRVRWAKGREKICGSTSLCTRCSPCSGVPPQQRE